MTELVFFYGTLMSGFERQHRADVDPHLRFIGRGSIPGVLYDVGIYPAAIPADDTRVWGEVHELLDAEIVLPFLDEIEGYDSGRPEASLYIRTETPVTFDDGGVAYAWVYFYNAPLGKALRIESGDYLQHLGVR